MKKIIIAVALVVATTVASFAGVTVGLTVEFGHKDAQGNCIEKGLCKIGITVGGNASIMGRINDGKNFEVLFKKTSTSNEILDYQFVNELFEVPVDYVLPADVCAKLGVEKYTIKKGKYKVVETNSSYSIIFANK